MQPEPNSIMEPAWNSVGDSVFVHDDKFAWIPGIIVEFAENKESAKVKIQLPGNWKATTFTKETTTGSIEAEKWVDLSTYPKHKLPLRSDQLVGDMASLPHLHEASILYQVKGRHAINKPYTRVGDIIVAVNPCQWIKELYTPENQRAYALELVWQEVPERETEPSSSEEKKDDKEAPPKSSGMYDRLGFEPHVYEVSALAYRGLALNREDQTILVSGESGAGKTETVKIVLQHLARMPEWRPDCDGYQGDLSNHLVEKIIEGLPIFESFGNAKTRRNHNSSRFGKVTCLHFSVDEGNHVCLLQGTKSHTYLLETSRLVSLSPGERNFHIFYQLLAAPKEMKIELLGDEWKDAPANAFRYLITSSDRPPSDESDLMVWSATYRALQFYGWKSTRLKTLLRALGVVLRLGNITFTETDGEAAIKEKGDIDLLGRAVGIPAVEMEQAFTRKKLRTAKELVHVPYTADQAKEACDALAKAIYSQLFVSVTKQLNDRTAAVGQEDDYHVISLVDIFGFENFERNGFEQLCVNYTSEKLQQKYVLDSLLQLQTEYTEEGVGIIDYKSIDNSDVLALFESPSGLIRTLDEECLRPNGSNESFVYKMKRSNKQLVAHDLQTKTEFGIFHFAGTAVYDANNFIEQNSDKLPLDLIELFTRSSNMLVSRGLCGLLKDEATLEPTKKMKVTILEKFRVQLRSLLESVRESQMRYIRCVKPNENLEAILTDHSVMLRQLRCAGLVAATDLSRETFPNKLSFLALESRFACLLSIEQRLVIKDMPLHDRAAFITSQLFAAILEQYRGRDFDMPFACGKTKVFFRAGALELIEDLRYSFFSLHATRLQQLFRRTLCRTRFRKLLHSTILVQALLRGKKCKVNYSRKKNGFTRLQAEFRGREARKVFLQRKRCVIILQKWSRSHVFNHAVLRNAATRIQTLNRSWQARITYLTNLYSAIIIQRWFRSRRAVRSLAQKKKAIYLLHEFGKMTLVRSHYKRFLRSIVILQSMARAKAAMQRKKEQNEAALRLTRWARHQKTEQERPHNSSSAPSACMYCGHGHSERQTDLATEISKFREKESAYLETVDELRAGETMHRQRIKELNQLHACDRQRITELEAELAASRNNKDKFKRDLEKKQARGISALQESQYLEQIKGLQSKETSFRQEIEELRRDVIQITADAELHNQEVEAEYNERLSDYEKEVVGMQTRIARLEAEKEQIQNDMAIAQKNHMKTVHLLQQSIKETTDSHKDYLGRITSLLDSSNESRQSETARFAKELEGVKSSRGAKIQVLEEQVRAGRAELVGFQNSRKRLVANGIPSEIHRLARKLEGMLSSDHIISVLVEEAKQTTQGKAVYLEAEISTKCRRTLHRLEDVVAVALSDDKGARDGSESDAEVVGLQNKLVKAYEDIEQLQRELQLDRSGLDPNM